MMAGLYYWKVIGHHLRNLALPGGVAFFLMLVELLVKQCFRRRSVPAPNLAAEPDPPPATVVFPPNEQIARAGAYRIPSLLALPPAASPVLLSFAEERTIGGVEDGGPVRVVVRRSGDRGQTWSPVALVADGDSVGIPGGTVGNPCAIYDAVRGRVVLLLSASEAYESEATIWCGHAAARRVFVTTSCDGAAWSRPREISGDVRPKGAGPTSPSGWTWYATGPGVGVQLPGGRLVFPCNHVSPTRGWLRTRYELRSHVVISDDGGDSFRLGGEGPAECNEAQVALVGGRLLLSMRDWSGRGRRRVAVSEDEGESWRDRGHAGDLPDPGFAGCQASLLAVPGGALYCGPLGAPSGLTRHTLLLRASRDGLSWGGAAEPSAGLWARVLHRGPVAYSCVARVGEGLVAVLYEAGETRPDEQIRCCLVAHPAP